MMKKKYIAWILIVSILFLGRGADAMAKTSLSKPLGVLANGVDGQVVLSWESVQRADGYEVFEITQFQNKKRGSVYQYKVRAYKIYKKNGEEKRIYSSFGAVARTTVAKNSTSTIKNFLTTALAPVGSTMYIWGGGWIDAAFDAFVT